MSRSYNKMKQEELYSLDLAIAKFISPRIKYYIDNKIKKYSQNDFVKIYDAMQQIIELNGCIPSPKENKVIRAGLFALYKNFQVLWY